MRDKSLNLIIAERDFKMAWESEKTAADAVVKAKRKLKEAQETRAFLSGKLAALEAEEKAKEFLK